jgi:hypothetical protein
MTPDVLYDQMVGAGASGSDGTGCNSGTKLSATEEHSGA